MKKLMVSLIIGHFIGDFFFQTRDMANNKYLSGKKGFWWCTVHVLVYTTFVVMFAGVFSPVFILGVFVPHWVIDRYSVGYRWMKVIGRAYMLESPKPVEASFGAIIYVVIDQIGRASCRERV